MKSPIPSIILPHCWICGVRFTDSIPPGPASKERHHIIPRKAGGVDGPTVDVCDDHHGRLHKIALRLSSKKPYFELVINESPESKQKLMWLAVQVYNAFEFAKGDPNKKVGVMLNLDLNQQHMIDRLKKIYPTLKSRESIMALALQSLYSRHFTEE